MPQDVPVEASETLAFTPPCLVEIPAAPTFMLRTPTPRDKRMQRRLFIEEGVRSHSAQSVRAEVIEGLRQLWSPDDFAKHEPIIKAYWEAQEDFSAQKKALAKNSPAEADALVWAYDQDIERAVIKLTQRVGQAHQPLRKMLADNVDFGDMQPVIMAAIMVKSWVGMVAKPKLDSGYLTIDCALALRDELEKFDDIAGVPDGTAWTELFVHCAKRMYLDEEESGNFGSPSPSATPLPASSVTTTSDMDGTFPASATSTETHAIG